jgi:hypothetical protein
LRFLYKDEHLSNRQSSVVCANHSVWNFDDYLVVYMVCFIMLSN